MDSHQSVSLSPTQATPPSSKLSSSQGSTGISSIPIRAPLSADSDFESALKTHSRSSSSDSVKSFVSEEGFLSGEDGFETASEKHFVQDPDDENLELAMEGVDIVPKAVLGSSRFSTAPPKARVTGDDDDDYDDVDDIENVDDGVPAVVRVPSVGGLEKLDAVVEAPKGRVLGVEEGEEGKSSGLSEPVEDEIVGDSNKTVGDNLAETEVPASLELIEDKVPIGADDLDESLAMSKEAILPENLNSGSYLKSSENGVVDSEDKGPPLEENPVLDSGSKELVGVGAVEASTEEALVVSKEDSVHENPKLDGIVNPEEKEEEETKDEVVQDKEGEDEAFGMKDEAFDDKNSEGLTSENGQASPGNIEVSDSAFVEKDDEVKLASQGNSPVETMTISSGTESGGVGDVKDNDTSETTTVEVEESGTPETIPVEVEENGTSETKSVEVEENGSSKIKSVEVGENITSVAKSVEVEENGTLEAKAVEVEVEKSLSPGVVSEQSPVAIDEPHDSEVVETGIVIAKAEVDNGKLSASEENHEPVVESVDENSTSDTNSKEEVERSLSTFVVPEQSPVVVDQPDDSKAAETGVDIANVDDIDDSKVEVERSLSDVVSEQSPAVIDEPDDPKAVETDTDVAKVDIDDSKVEVERSLSSGVQSEQSPAVLDELDDSKAVDMAKVDDIDDSKLEVERSFSAGVVSKQSPAFIDETDGSKAVETGIDIAKEPDHPESQIEATEVQKDVDKKNDSSIAKNISYNSENNSDKPEFEDEPQTNSESKLCEPMSGSAAEDDRNALGDELDGFGGAQGAEDCTESGEMNTVQEDKIQDFITKSSDVGEDGLEDMGSNSSDAPKSTIPTSVSVSEVKKVAEDEVDHPSDYEEVEGSDSDEDNEELNFGSSGTAEQIMKELMRGSGVSFRSGAESSQDSSQRVDGQILMDSDDEVDTDQEGEGNELFDSAALTALLKAATSAGAEGGNVTITSQDGSRLFSVERPAGLGSSIRSLKPAPQPSRPNIFTSSDLMTGGESENVLSEEEKKKLEKIQLVRVKFLRLIHRLGYSSDEAIAAQVLYRMVLAAGRQTGQAFSLETAKKTAMQLEAENRDDLDFSLNILVLGKTGVGKSATINSIFGEEKAKIGAFEPATTMVKEIIGTVGGVKIRVFDTPGLRSSVMEQAFNRKVLSSVKKLTKKFPLDILLYVDRLDTQTRDLNDLPLLRTITNTLGTSVWRSAVVTLTHASSAPPDGPSGSPLSYEVFVAQRSHIVQQSIGQAVGDLRMMNPSLMNPVSLVENHPSCRKNREGHRILPNGQSWRPQLLLLCYSLKVLSEVSSLSKPQDAFDQRKLFGFRVRAPPLPYLLSSLLQSRAHPKLPDDQGGENVDSDIDLEDLEDSDQEEEDDEYDQLPPFKPLRKAQIAKLSKDQRKAYFDEYDYRVKLLQKKQWKEELKRMKEMKKKGKYQADNSDFPGEDADQEGPAAVPVPLPDMVLPPSFDGDNAAYRYRFLEPTSQLLARPVLDTHGWDHDCGYDAVSLEQNLALAGRFPGGVAVQITKDKKEFSIHLDSSIAAKYGENGSILAGFDIQPIGKQLGYIVRGETKFKNFRKNKTTGGISVTFLGENVATGVKVEDQISIGKRLTLVGSTGTIRSQGDAAYGANLEATLKDKDFPIGQDQSTLGLSLMRWRGDLALGANFQSQVSIGRSSKMSVRVGLNNKLSGQITVRTSSSEQLQLALVGILPIAVSIYRSIWPSTGESFSAY